MRRTILKINSLQSPKTRTFSNTTSSINAFSTAELGNKTHLEQTSLYEYACTILNTPNPKQKSNLSILTKELWFSRKLKLSALKEQDHHAESPPIYPARPEFPKCVSPKLIPSHKKAGVPLPIYLLHGLAHIELNAIDMVWDMLTRFKDHSLPLEWYDDWVEVAEDESRHFLALSERLEALGSSYGALLAHDSLWKNAEKTSDNLKARIAVMQLVQEARALDSHQRLLHKVGSNGDKISMRLVDTICNEEVAHVKKGVKWFEYLCARENIDPVNAFHEITIRYVDTKFPPPFNVIARSAAGMHEEYYLPMSIKQSNDAHSSS